MWRPENSRPELLRSKIKANFLSFVPTILGDAVSVPCSAVLCQAFSWPYYHALSYACIGGVPGMDAGVHGYTVDPSGEVAGE